MNRNDIRYQKTEEAIIRAFIGCVSENGFEQSRVAHLCTAARISRNTFYAHYTDKYQLLHSICMTLKKDMRQDLNRDVWEGIVSQSFELPVAWCMEAVDRHRDLLKVLLRCSREEVSKLMADVFIDELMERIVPHYRQVLEQPRVQLSRGYMLSAMVGFIQVWLESIPETPLDEVKAMMLGMCSASVNHFMETAREAAGG